MQLGDGAFHEASSFEVNNLSALQSISIGNECLAYSQSVSLYRLNKLEGIMIGRSSFFFTASLSLVGWSHP